MKNYWSFFSAGQLTFGKGVTSELGEMASRRGWKRILVVTDQVLMEIGPADRIRQSLELAGIEVAWFAGGAAEPAIEVAEAASAAAQEFKPDAILGFGGGSNIDVAKFTAIVVQHGGQPSDYFGFDNVPGPVAPLIAVPTTAGTGSEVSHAAVLTDTANEMKVSCMSNYLRPALALVDPELTYSCPPTVAADSGIDALTHAIEAYTAVDFDKMPIPSGERSSYEGRFPLGERIAEAAIEIIGRQLIPAVNDPQNTESRDEMALAASLAGLAFSNCGVAIVHALEYPLGGKLHCSHGAGNGLLLPYVMRFNMPERIPTFGRIARLLGRDTAGMTDEQAAEEAILAVEHLRTEIGIPNRIRDIGGREDQLPMFASKSHAIERLQWVNPRPATYEQFLGILNDAF